jgi:hypothetical protein
MKTGLQRQPQHFKHRRCQQVEPKPPNLIVLQGKILCKKYDTVDSKTWLTSRRSLPGPSPPTHTSTELGALATVLPPIDPGRSYFQTTPGHSQRPSLDVRHTTTPSHSQCGANYRLDVSAPLRARHIRRIQVVAEQSKIASLYRVLVTSFGVVATTS